MRVAVSTLRRSLSSGSFVVASEVMALWMTKILNRHLSRITLLSRPRVVQFLHEVERETWPPRAVAMQKADRANTEKGSARQNTKSRPSRARGSKHQSLYLRRGVR